MKKLAVLAISVLLFSSCTQQTKIGYVDIQELMKEYDATKLMEDELKGEQEKMSKSLDSMMVVFQTKVESFYSKAKKMSNKTREAKGTELKQEELMLQQAQQQAQLFLQQKSQEGIQSLTKKVDSVVSAYASANKFNLILGTQGTGTVMYGDDNINLTEAILDVLNAEHEEKTK